MTLTVSYQQKSRGLGHQFEREFGMFNEEHDHGFQVSQQQEYLTAYSGSPATVIPSRIMSKESGLRIGKS